MSSRPALGPRPPRSGFVQALRSRVDDRLWHRLREAAPQHVDRLCPLPDRFLVHPPEPRRPIVPGLVVFGFHRDGRPIPDVRDPADATAVANQLHDRVRYLCRELRDTVLIGSVAGGRKNFGPALQAAFELQARPTDRLVHVLLHPEIEAHQESFAAYVAPERPVRGIEIADQLTVFDLPFPPLRYLLPEGPWRKALDREDAVVLWDELRRNVANPSERTARLEEVDPKGRRWALSIECDGSLLRELSFSGGVAETYAALVALHDKTFAEGTELEEWGDYIHVNRLGRRKAAPKPPTVAAMRRRLSDAAIATRFLIDVGLAEFAIHQDGARTCVPAALSVTVPPPRRLRSGGANSEG